MAYPRPQELTTLNQWLRLKTNPLGGDGGVVRGQLTWDFRVRPTPLSREYDARLTYRSGQRPKIVVRRPDLTALAAGKPLPHVYPGVPPPLCLYLPRAGDWTPSLALADTVLPWTYLWLAYFEDWLVSGEWHGGGVHPGDLKQTPLRKT